MIISQRPTFKRAYKKLHNNQRKSVNEAIREVDSNPEIGELKVGDLREVRVYKFSCINQLWLLAYVFSGDEIALLSMGPHENFYDKLKR